MSIPTIHLVTAHGRQALAAGRSDRLLDVLHRHGIAWSGVSVYATDRAGGPPRPVAALTSPLAGLPQVGELTVYLNRNVNPLLFSLRPAATVATPTPQEAVTEYAYQDLDGRSPDAGSVFRELTAEECRSVVVRRVADCLRDHLPPRSTLVVGISGGGDSNALLHALSCLSDLELTVDPVILQGIPDWDDGLPRARELCARYGLELTVLAEADVAGLLGMDSDRRSLVDRFESAFPGDDFEFLGTLLIRLALARRARELGTPFICTGLNFEDVLCEGMYRISAGMPPAPAPVRVIGDISLLLPLWRCPKRILDGCFPKYSLDNYVARYPCFSLGRNLYYSVTYALQSQFPGYAEQLLTGMASLAAGSPSDYRYDEELGFEVERSVPFPLRRAFRRMRASAPTG